MPTMTFRFITECEITLEGESYEEAYLKFKEVYQNEKAVCIDPTLKIYPPESSTIYFEIDEQNTFTPMENIKGNFKQDVIANLAPNWLERIESIKAMKH